MKQLKEVLNNEGHKIKLGLKVYYTGDMANVAGFGKVVKIESGRFGDTFDIKIEDGRLFKRHCICGIGFEYFGSCAGVVTLKAYNDYQKKSTEIYYKKMNELREVRNEI